MQEILQRCRWDFVIRSFKAVKSNHEYQQYQAHQKYHEYQNITSIVKIHKYSKIHRKEQDRSLSKTKHDQVLFWTIR